MSMYMNDYLRIYIYIYICVCMCVIQPYTSTSKFTFSGAHIQIYVQDYTMYNLVHIFEYVRRKM